MRIIGGNLRGHRFSVPNNIKARPTTDFARENLFNVLSNKIDFTDKYALDLFSGTGSISFELVSRGCEKVELMEINGLNYKHILKNINHLKIENIEPHKYDVFKFLPKTSNKYDFIFADPPYDLKGIDNLPGLIFTNNLLKEDGIFILEHSNKYSFKGHSNFTDLRKYGSVHFSFFEK